MKTVSGQTAKALLEKLEDWKSRHFQMAWCDLPEGSKQQAVVAWTRAVEDQATADAVVNAIKQYAKHCQKNDIRKCHFSTYVNQARWENQPIARDKPIETDPSFCSQEGCGQPATQLHPSPLCCRHWTDRHSKQFWDGEYRPYKQVLAIQLKKMGLPPHDKETNAEFHLRCREAGRTAFYKSRKSVGMDQGKRV